MGLGCVRLALRTFTLVVSQEVVTLLSGIAVMHESIFLYYLGL